MAEKWEICPRTSVATLLLLFPELIDLLISFDAHLEPLRDDEACRMLAPRLSLADVAYESGTPVEEILSAVERAMDGEACPS